MFDINQNFNNNIKPLFNTNDNVQNNDSNSEIMSNFNIQNNDINFSSDVNNLPPGDIPPKLGEIKNLNEATIVNAPSMDALGPVNIMSENPDFNNDPIMSYEKGEFNLPSLENVNFDQNVSPNLGELNSYDNISDITSIRSNDFELNNDNNDFLSNNINDNNSDVSSFLQSIRENTNNTLDYNQDISTNFRFPEPSNLNETQQPFNSLDLNQSIVGNDFFKTPFLEEKHNDGYNLINNEDKNLDVSFDSPINDKENDNQDYTIIQNQTLEESGNHDYAIVQNKPLEEKHNLDNLGIDNLYDEEDTLDIIDFEQEEVSNNNMLKQEKNELLDIVEKIKKLINELKDSGVDINIEEFDFEHMYQLIVKINK